MFLKKLNPIRRIRELTEELSRTRRERDQARKEGERLQRQTEDLQRELKRIQEENNQLRKDLELAQRAARRQAAPFSRGQLKSHPKSLNGAANSNKYQEPPGCKTVAAMICCLVWVISASTVRDLRNMRIIIRKMRILSRPVGDPSGHSFPLLSRLARWCSLSRSLSPAGASP